jgi:hypothetical protein
MKRVIIIGGFIIGLIFLLMAGIYIWIGQSVKAHISEAIEMYSGDAEDALIAFVSDPENSFYDRTHKGVWTLGQIRSEKALPLLYQLYQNDPDGETCYGQHDSSICQYEIHKAISSIENWSPFNHQRLGSK